MKRSAREKVTDWLNKTKRPMETIESVDRSRHSAERLAELESRLQRPRSDRRADSERIEIRDREIPAEARERVGQLMRRLRELRDAGKAEEAAGVRARTARICIAIRW